MSGLTQRMLLPLLSRLQLVVGRAVVALVNDQTKLQGLQVELLAGEVRDSAERFQQYGFTSHPQPGAEAVALAVGGSRDHMLVVSVDDRRYRLRSLAPGEVALYTDEGDKIVLRRGGIVEITAATKVRVASPLVEMTGNLSVSGSIDSGATITAAADVRDQGGAKSMAGMRAAYNPHVHGGSAPPSTSM